MSAQPAPPTSLFSLLGVVRGGVGMLSAETESTKEMEMVQFQCTYDKDFWRCQCLHRNYSPLSFDKTKMATAASMPAAQVGGSSSIQK